MKRNRAYIFGALVVLAAATATGVTIVNNNPDGYEFAVETLAAQDITQTQATFRANMTEMDPIYDAGIVYWNYTNGTKEFKGPFSITSEPEKLVEARQDDLRRNQSYDVEAYAEPLIQSDDTLEANLRNLSKNREFGKVSGDEFKTRQITREIGIENSTLSDSFQQWRVLYENGVYTAKKTKFDGDDGNHDTFVDIDLETRPAEDPRFDRDTKVAYFYSATIEVSEGSGDNSDELELRGRADDAASQKGFRTRVDGDDADSNDDNRATLAGSVVLDRFQDFDIFFDGDGDFQDPEEVTVDYLFAVPVQSQG
jgi:hypothetical protein